MRLSSSMRVLNGAIRRCISPTWNVSRIGWATPSRVISYRGYSPPKCTCNVHIQHIVNHINIPSKNMQLYIGIYHAMLWNEMGLTHAPLPRVITDSHNTMPCQCAETSSIDGKYIQWLFELKSCVYKIKSLLDVTHWMSVYVIQNLVSCWATDFGVYTTGSVNHTTLFWNFTTGECITK